MDLSKLTEDGVGKLRVVQLKSILSKAGGDAQGKKAVLVGRVKELLRSRSKRDRPSSDGEDADADTGDAAQGKAKRRRQGSNGSAADSDADATEAPKEAEAGSAPATGSGSGSGSGSGAGGAGAGAGAGAGDDDDDSSSDDDFGPALPAAKPKKKKKALAHEQDFLDKLPSANMYEKSFMHRDRLSHIVVAPTTDFVITASVDGHLKFWKKMARGIEFVKHYKAHLAPFSGVAVSADGLRLCTTSEDQTIKFYDVSIFDMTVMVPVTYEPGCCEWIFRRGAAVPVVAVADKAVPVIRVYRGDTGSAEALREVSLHVAPVTAMRYNPRFNVVISGDDKGGLEYWSAKTYKPPKKVVKFRFKSDTDLFALNKAKASVASIDCSPDGTSFVVTSSDFQVRVFRYTTGKLRRVYDESPGVYEDAHLEGALGIDDMDYGRRMAVERDLRNSKSVPPSNALFDQTGHFIMYPTLLGVKVVNIETNRTVRIIGKIENTERFCCIALFQGIPNTDTQMELLQKKGKPTIMNEDNGPKHDPTIICTAYKKHRLYLFSRREPDDTEGNPRDVFNEAPRKEDRLVEAEASKQAVLGKEAVVHTTYGDIRIKLFPEECPRTIENFSVHSRKGYYNGCIFHRVIKNFMVQTGDPLGNGTGGESIWGGEFEDEFHHSLRHDRAFTVSMANGGPNTNGSQFFITTVPCPWLDNKHTVFGRVTAGQEVVTRIESTKCDKGDRPFEEIKIMNVDIV